MRFPPLEKLPPLTETERQNWYYPAYQNRPYTPAFANKLVTLNTVEENFWRHLKFLKKHKLPADIYFDLQPYGQQSLPVWKFSLQGESFQALNTPSTIHIEIGDNQSNQKSPPNSPRAYFQADTDLTINLKGDYSSRQSALGEMLRHLLPYIDAIYIVTDDDQADFLI